MDWKELKAQPDGVVFCEVDLPPMPLFVKIGDDEDDIMVEPLFDPDDISQSRFGFQEMDECTRNSKKFHVLKGDDISRVMRILNRRKHASFPR